LLSFDVERAPSRLASAWHADVSVATIMARSFITYEALNAVTRALAAGIDLHDAAARACRAIVPVLADACCIDVVEQDVVRRVAVAFGDAAGAREIELMRAACPCCGDETPHARALAGGAAVLLGEEDAARLVPPSAHAAIRPHAAIVLPLVSRSSTIGVLTLLAMDRSRGYDACAVSEAEGAASCVAAGLHNVMLVEAAQRATRTRDEMLSMVSHDLRNYLATISLSAEVLHVPRERRKERKHIKAIQQGAARMRRLTDDLLDVGSLDAGRLPIQRCSADASALISDAVDTERLAAREKGIELGVASMEKLAVDCDPDRVLQVLTNLIANAIKFTPKGGHVVLGARREEADALLWVRDDGPGITAGAQQQLFERFWQAEWNVRKGRGLGLYIAKRLVELQGGTIKVESATGLGATFSFTLPLAHASA
jgi:signal transduction histidine kinase